MHNFISNLKILNVPKIINYDKKLKQMTMEKIPAMSLSDYYGESIDQVQDSPCGFSTAKIAPEQTIVKEVRQIIGKLQANNITYPDITGYNFINFNDKIWIIDVNEFVKGLNSWNPYFK
jgi:tRNA A-37 threonylcarbamoyl transferase component Bud32